MLNLFQHPWPKCHHLIACRGKLPWMLKQVQHDGVMQWLVSERLKPICTIQNAPACHWVIASAWR
ncbi:MAG: hypothetical protein KGQ52_10630 [Alphaproteobacteria bacterium]|nr:hypothetical protein [Alphaproteobacteria bacterium]